MSNSLTRDAGFKLGPIAFETFVKHYYEKLVKEVDEKRVPLRKEELLYDEVFHIVKSFLAQASRKHTVEELQGFSNTRTPNTPANHVVRVTVPLSCCDEAAESLIRTFGGEEAMKKTAGGVKWWQVRGIRGVNAEWMCAKKDMVEAQRRSRARSGPAPRKDPRARASKFGLFTTWDVPTRPDSPPEVQSKSSSEPADHSPGRGADGEDVYRPEMDGMKCILFFHGGGYYFGSVDQERYTIQRMARKIRGRVLAVNYRLAPQYPFPCAIQDILASYLFLIRPPSSAAHAPISPSDIVIAGDSAGGGLALALLQVLRDSELPLPAGGILISPWCDLTHSFPSIFQNTETDVIPATGLSIHKPSSLWPPPDEDTTAKMREGLRTTVSKAIRRHRWGGSTPDLDGRHVGSPLVDERPTNQSVVTLPPADVQADQTVMVETQQGSTVEIKSQLHLYVPNGLISHPLVSSALSYLGGLPPLLFIASDREVLRDEVIYAAHRAAHPEQFPIRDDTRAMYPPFKDLDTTSMKPTVVHLQVYDDAAHVLPVLFPFTQPAKYCFRAMATFCKQVFEVRPIPIITGSALRQSPKEEKELFIASDHAEMQGPTDGLKTAPSPDEESHRELHQANGESSTSSSLPNSKATQPMPLRQPEDEGHSTSNSTHRNPQDSLLLTTAPSTNGELSSSGLHPPIALEFSVDTPIKATSLNGALERPSSSEDTQKTQSRSTRFSDTDLPPPSAADPIKQDGSLSTSGSRPSKLKRRGSEGATTNLRPRSSFKAISGAIARYGTLKRHPKKESGSKAAPVERVGREGSEDVAGPRGKGSEPRAPSDVLAGDPIVYSGGWPSSSSKHMIRERVSTQGIIRPLELQQDLSAFSVPETQVGAVPVPAIQRYLAAKENMDRKYARAIRRIARERAHAIAHADAGQVAHMHRLQHYLDRQREGDNNTGESVLGLGVLGANWNLAWALDAEERPPPSSIVARRDTKEAIALASVADQAIFVSESSLNANNLWSLMINFFTAPPREKEKETRQEYVVGEKEKQRKRRSSLGFWRVGHNARAQREGPENTQAGERKEATRQAQIDLSPSATS